MEKIQWTPIKRGKKYARHTFLYKKYFFPCFTQICINANAFKFTKAMPYKILIFRKSIKAEMFILKLKIITKTNIFAKIQPDGKDENFNSVFLHRQISTISFTLLTLPILNIIEKSFSPPKPNQAKIQLRKIILSLIFYKDYYNLYAKYIQKVQKSNGQKKSELAFIFIYLGKG